MQNIRKGMLLVISGPSGAGKGTLLGKLLKEDDSFMFSVSATTRQPRNGEIDGVHYHFMTEEQFVQLIGENAFVEHAQVHGNRYGTLRSEVEQRLADGQNVLLDIDTQGALNVMKMMPDCVSVFVLPPSITELRRRLVDRGTETVEAIERRMGNARQEISLMDSYQYVIVNNDLDQAYDELRSIVKAEKQRTSRYHPVVE